MSVYVIFDDTSPKSEIIKDIIGEKGFADVVVKKKTLEEHYRQTLAKLYPDFKWLTVRSVFEFHALAENISLEVDEKVKVLHCFSDYMITDAEKALLSYEKLLYLDDDYRVVFDKKTVAVMFPNLRSYLSYLKRILSGQASVKAAGGIEDFFCIDGMFDISMVGNFIQCITGNFDSRYFNTLQGNEYTIVKSSVNKDKIKSEYCYYHLLPDDMKMWYVLPFDYQEDGQVASYRMERLHMADLAVKWVHGSIGLEEFEEVLDKYFYFFKTRHQKTVTGQEYEKMVEKLYLNKVISRVSDLKKQKQFGRIRQFIESGLPEHDIDGILNRYIKLKIAIENKNNYPKISVIGHGDPCFANTLYNRPTKTLKFIDPKGALKEQDLWTNPYYDIAKLSHSICGRYDFFNQGLFDIRIDGEFSYELHVGFDNEKYVGIFKRKLEENGYDYLTVRIYEASLFLSMLPLHIDSPRKVFAFLLNARNILKEIEQYVS